MSDTRISAADLLRLAAIASVSPEGTADEVVAILQRTGPVEVGSDEAAAQIGGLVVQNEVILGDAAAAAADADSDKLAKPE